MKIAIVHPRMDIKGGAENVIVRMTDLLTKAGHVVEIFAKTENVQSLWPQLSAPVYSFENQLTKIFKSKRTDRMVFQKKYAARLKEFDIVMAHNFPSILWVFDSLKNLPGRPRVVWYCHEPRRDLYAQICDEHIWNLDNYLREEYAAFYEPLKASRNRMKAEFDSGKKKRDRKWDQQAISFTDHILCNSQYTASLVQKIYGREGRVCYPPILSPPSDVQPMPEATVFGAVVSLFEKKNFLGLLAGFMKYRENGGNSILRVGAREIEPIRALSEKMFSKAEVNASMKFVSLRNDRDLFDFYDSISLCLYLTIDEPLGLIPVEAAFRERPSLLSEFGGPAELAAAGFGFCADPFDPAQIAAKLQEAEKKDLKNMGSRAADAARAVFSEEARLSDLLANLLPEN